MGLKTRAALLLAFVGLWLGAFGDRALAAEKPSIVYIIADDLGYGDVQCLNPERGKIATPNIDRFASQGMTFTDAHSGSAVCTPTRYGLLTGRYAWRTRLQQGVLDGGDDEPLIAGDRLTVPKLLQQQGYSTACVGKWHLGYTSERPVEDAAPSKGKKTKAEENTPPVGSKIIGGPTTRGFDLFWGCSNARTMAALVENDRVIESLAPVDMLPRLGARAVQYIEERATDARGGKPFFLYLPLTSPHTPIVPAPEWHGKSPLGSYADFVMQTDAVVGQVLAALDRARLTDHTLVVFTSDNGCSPAAKTEKLEQAGHFASAGFRGYKADIWEGGHRVPFFVRWPGRIKAGSKSDQLICHSDLMATCAEIVGAKLPDDAGEDSVSILPALLGLDTAPVHEAVVHHSISGRFAIRQGSWKLCLCAGSGGWSKDGDAESPQLYRLDVDPGERTNMQAANPEVVARLTALLESYQARGRSTPGAEQRNDVAVELFKS
ncbi:MAG TPA: arylsulfatase [Caulifigura sp.]|nr:arylsulfatase [Caulifigura sp.]